MHRSMKTSEKIYISACQDVLVEFIDIHKLLFERENFKN